MEKKKFEIKNLKEIAEDAGQAVIGLGNLANEKAKPVVDIVGKGFEKIVKSETITEEKRSKILKEKENAPESGFDVEKILNSVIEGAYCNCFVTGKKGILYVGDKEISHVNCESYETGVSSDLIAKIKKEFVDYRKHCINPLMKFGTEKYITIQWRNGDRSVACVDASKYDQIIKLLS